MPTSLNYGADTTGLFTERAPFSVKVDPNKPPGDRFKDYVPKNPGPQVKADDSIRHKSFMRPPVARYTEDFISGADAAVKRKNEKARILQIAKEMWDGESNKRKMWTQAQELSDKSDASSTDKEVVKARKILERTAPLTKQMCLDKAAAQFYGTQQ